MLFCVVAPRPPGIYYRQTVKFQSVTTLTTLVTTSKRTVKVFMSTVNLRLTEGIGFTAYKRPVGFRE